MTDFPSHALSIVFDSGEPKTGNYGLGIKNGQKYLFDITRGCAKVQCRFILIYKQAMSINTETTIKFSDLEEVVIINPGSCNAYVDSAFHKGWDRDLTEVECDLVTEFYQQELYELALSRL